MIKLLWLAVFCSADLEPLLNDDECQAGSCALHALQLQRRPVAEEEHLETLCSEAAGVCKLLSGSEGASSLTLADLHTLLAVAPSTFQAFAEAVRLEKTALEGDRVLCAKLCRVSAQYLAKQSVVLPPAPDIGCYRDVEGQDVCTEDLSPQTLATRFQNAEDLGASRHQATSKAAGSHRRQRSTVRLEDPFQHGFETLVKSYSTEMALRILYMFRVYPRAFNTYLANSDAQPNDWQSKLAKFNLVARVFVMNAIRNLRLHKTVPHLATWFGDEAVTELSLKETRVEVLRLLNSAVHVMNTAEFIYNASGCDEDSIFAFVYPTAYDGVPDLQGVFRKNHRGQFVVYVCPLTVNAETLGLLADAVQTSVHESSHHAVAYLDDVVSCPQSQYMWMETAGLQRLSASRCPGSLDEQPRFSISGSSCNVPGVEIQQLANITRPTFARGPSGSVRCPANMAGLKTADVCKEAAKSLGTVYGGEEEDSDWPQGCYEIAGGFFQGVYFNNASKGTGLVGTHPLCETLPWLGKLEKCIKLRMPGQWIARPAEARGSFGN
ncbi:unnamed protein product [Symbiodinium pilosum]|uniref:Uncharacterized protein n=1 Tax=Symbiodinium pilosum TaxID=2952 RepID=A0A812U8Z1_SYMPI|nr:unnamed protein product [Symbiodinium pilosum]